MARHPRQDHEPARGVASGFVAGTLLENPPFRLGNPYGRRSETDPGLPPGFDPIWGTLGPQTPQGSDDWLAGDADDADGLAVDVAILGDGFQISGRILTGRFERLSDWINMQSGFIQVLDARYIHARQTDSPDPDARTGRLWVRLDQIVLVAELSNDQIERLGVPEVSKQRQMVSIVTHGYRLRGDLHVHTHGSMSQFLERPDPHFLPITGLTVRWLSDATQVALFPFAAINRRQLVTVLEEEDARVDGAIEQLDRSRDAVSR